MILEEQRILLVEDDDAAAQAAAEWVKEAGIEKEKICRVSSLKAALSALAASSFEVVLLDSTLPDLPRLAGLKTLLESYPDLPVIVFLPRGEESLGEKAMEQGAADYLIKEETDGRLLRRSLRSALAQRQRKEAEKALRQREENYRLLLENMGDFIVKIDLEGRYLFVSPNLCQLLEKSEAELLGQRFFEVVSGFTTGELMVITRALFKPPYVYYFEHLIPTPKGDREVAWSLKAVLDEEEKVKAVIAVGRDMTVWKEYEKAIVRFERLMEAVFLTIPSVLILMDDKLRVLRANRRFEEIMNLSPRQIEGRRITSLLPSFFLAQENLLGKLELCALSGADSELRGLQHTSPHHPPRSLDIFIRSIRTLEKKNLVLLVINDVTEVASLRNQLYQAQKMEALGHLAAGVVHEFNNNLQPILATADALLRELPPTHPYCADLRLIRSAAERSAAFSRQLLAFSRQEVFTPQQVNLNTAVNNLKKTFGRILGENISLELNLEADLHQVLADPSQLEQVLINLALNARDAMAGAGRLIIETANVRLKENSPFLLPDVPAGEYVLLSVRDTGKGMNPEVLSRIFEPFFTTKESGTGLGLPTVYGIVKQNRGHIEVESEPGAGTVFKIYLPAVEEKELAVERRRGEKEERPSPQGRILVVEDNEIVRRSLMRLLEMQGYEFMEAANGEEALALFRCDYRPFHLLITDMAMPGMSGWELAAKLRQYRPELKVLFISGYLEKEGFPPSFPPGTAFLYKPFTLEALEAALRQLRESGGEGGEQTPA